MENTSEAMVELEAAGFVLSTEGNDLVIRGGRADAKFTPHFIALIEAYKGQLFEIVMRRWVQANVEGLLAGAHAKEAEIAESYEARATMAGCLPPYQRVLTQQAWVATIDWSRGFRCARTKRQCTACTGMPCRGSTAW